MTGKTSEYSALRFLKGPCGRGKAGEHFQIILKMDTAARLPETP